MLRSKIQDLIDNGQIVDPEAQRLNVNRNPVPNYNRGPPRNVNVITNDGIDEKACIDALMRVNEGNEEVQNVIQGIRNASMMTTQGELSYEGEDLVSSDEDIEIRVAQIKMVESLVLL